MIDNHQIKVVSHFSYFPKKIKGQRIWFKTYYETVRLVVEEHEACNDCGSPLTPCDRSPRKYWIHVSYYLK